MSKKDFKYLQNVISEEVPDSDVQKDLEKNPLMINVFPLDPDAYIEDSKN